MGDNYKQLYEKDNEEYKKFYPLTDILSIIDKESGKNLKQLLNQYNHIKLDWKGNTVDTRNSVPLILRHKGLFITYDTGRNIVTEYYTGDDISASINTIWQNDNNWTNFSVAAGLADQEDITEVNGKFKFADRNHNAAQFTGMGRIILRKNLVDVGDGAVKNVLTQDMINKSNTIYEIRYDFDLNGKEITIPEGCVLDFQGGNLNNGIVVGNNTTIKAELVKIFGLDINLSGTWNISEAYPEWFGAISDYKLNGTYTNNTPFFKKCADSFKHISLPIERKYYLNETLYINGDTSIFGNNSYIVINEDLDYGICITTNGGVSFNNAEIKDLTIHTNTQTPPKKQIYAFKIEKNVNKHFNNILLQPYGIGFIYFGNDVWDIEINSCNCRSYESTWNCVMFTHHTNINIKFNNFHIEGYDTVFTTTLENFDQNIYLNTFVVGGLTKTIIDGNKGCLYVFVNNFHIETDGMLGTQFKNANIVCTNGIYICTGILEEDIAYKCHITFNNVHFIGFGRDRYNKTKFSSSGTIIYNNCSSTATLAPAPSNSVPFNGDLSLKSFSDINIGWSENPDDTAVASQPVYVQNDSISLNGYDTGIYVKIPNNWNTNRICVSFDVMRTNAGAQATQLEVIGLCRDSKRTQVINRGGINITDRVLNDTYSTIKVLLTNIIEAGSPDISKLVYISTFGGFQTYKIKNINIFPLNYYY